MASKQQPDEQLEEVTEPRDTDVLCGRGGAALRHPGNQTYRRLVNLNKGLYITCLKTEKLKISRSIVAAIREQNGRFLEKNSAKGTYVDIGDKKAVEKTSQALRENQPKLREQINKMGGGVAGTAAFMESQYGHPGLYNPEQVGLTTAANMVDGNNPQQQQQQQRQHAAAVRHAQHQQQQQQQQQHARAAAGLSLDTNPDALLQKLSLSDISSPASSLHSLDTSSSHHHQQRQHHLQHQQQLLQRVHRLRPSINSNRSGPPDLGIPGPSNLSLMSDFSSYNGTSAASSTAGHVSMGTTMSTRISLPNETVAALSMDTSFRKVLSGLSGLPAGSGHTLSMSSNHSVATMNTRGLDTFSDHNLMNMSAHTCASLKPPPPASRHQQQHQQLSSSSMQQPPSTNATPPDLNDRQQQQQQQFDRRNMFAKMKYQPRTTSRSPQRTHQHAGGLSGFSQHSLGDGMDFNMVESNLSLMSSMSNHMPGSSHPAPQHGHPPMGNAYASAGGGGGDQNTGGGGDGTNNNATTSRTSPSKQPVAVEIAKVVDHSSRDPSNRYAGFVDVLGTGSRHSIMSGLSRISDTSIDQSIFSDLSRKIANVSTRSLAMSEMSGTDTERDITILPEDEDVSNSYIDGDRLASLGMGFLAPPNMEPDNSESKTEGDLEFHL